MNNSRLWALSASGILCLLINLNVIVRAESGPAKKAVPTKMSAIDEFKLLNRLTWGVNSTVTKKVAEIGLDAYLNQQLDPATAPLPEAVQKRIDAMTIAQQPVLQIVQTVENRIRDANALTNADEKKAAVQSYKVYKNDLMIRLGREAASRHILRGLYSPDQIQEQMTWFWINHFNIGQSKGNLRLMIGDYEENAIRGHALGKFRDLLGAVAHHPAMLRYLDNEQNAVGHINENYARELMELHTLGVDAGYTQQDVQNLARILTGVGINHQSADVKVRQDLQPYYVRRGLFEFNPNRHDFGNKQFLKQPISSRGLPELEEALDRLAKHPATATFISRKLALYWLSDKPSAQVIKQMTETFKRTDGNISATMKTLLLSPEFRKASGRKFKDPVRYLMSAVRLTYDDKPILNVNPIIHWLNRMGEPLYGRQTPDGYPLLGSAWTSSGQMATRFEIAKAIGFGSAGLFKSEGPDAKSQPAFPQLANELYYQSISKILGGATRKALDQANSPQEWNMLLLSSPEMMHR
jgi:uncharacterized protein (DUF1800 family)